MTNAAVWTLNTKITFRKKIIKNNEMLTNMNENIYSIFIKHLQKILLKNKTKHIPTKPGSISKTWQLGMWLNVCCKPPLTAVINSRFGLGFCPRGGIFFKKQKFVHTKVLDEVKPVLRLPKRKWKLGVVFWLVDRLRFLYRLIFVRQFDLDCLFQ